jgi:hypothetical protein
MRPHKRKAPRPRWMAVAITVALLLCSCGGGGSGGHESADGACVVDGTRKCTDNVSLGYCERTLRGDHYYETRTCRDLGFPP